MKSFKTDDGAFRFSDALFKGGFIHNPVLTQVIGICPVVAAATTLKNTAVLSVVLSLSLILCEAFSSLLLKNVSRNLRICLYCLLASVPTLISLEILDDKTISALGIFLPLLCVNGLVVIRCEKFAVRTSLKNAFFDALASSIGFTAVALAVGFFRELLAFGTVFSLKLFSFPTLSAFALPFGGLVILGFLAAAHKAVVLRFFKDELVDTFNFSKIFEKPVFKDPGLRKKQPKEKIEVETVDLDLIRPRYAKEKTESDDKKEESR